MESRVRKGIIAAAGLAVAIYVAGCVSSPAIKPDSEPETVYEDASKTVPDGAVPTIEETEVKAIVPVIPVVASVKIARSFKTQAERLGALVTHEDGSKEWRASKGNRQLVVTEGNRLAILDGVSIYLDEPMYQSKGRWMLSASDERLLLEHVFSSDKAKKERSVKTIVIDPGHGGSEKGTTNEALALLEKNLNLDVSLRLQTHLEELGYKVVLTRYDDRVVELEDRSKISNAAGANLFVSIHFNAALNEKAVGLETYMLTPQGQSSTSGSKPEVAAVAFPGNAFDMDNFELAFRIQKSMLNRLQRNDRGVRKSRFKVLRGIECAGVLVECGFLSNGEEALLISTAAFRERLALSLTAAIEAYANNTHMGEL